MNYSSKGCKYLIIYRHKKKFGYLVGKIYLFSFIFIFYTNFYIFVCLGET